MQAPRSITTTRCDEEDDVVGFVHFVHRCAGQALGIAPEDAFSATMLSRALQQELGPA
jgi:hypothetical protein